MDVNGRPICEGTFTELGSKCPFIGAVEVKTHEAHNPKLIMTAHSPSSLSMFHKLLSHP